MQITSVVTPGLILVFAVSIIMGASSFSTAKVVTSATCHNARQPATNIGDRIATIVKFRAGSPEKQKEIPHQGARYLRARIEVPNPGNCDWLLTVRDANYHVIQTFDRRDFQNSPNRWTNRVPRVDRPGLPPASSIIFTLSGCRGGSTPEIRFPEYIMMAEKTKNPYYSWQNSGFATYKALYSLTDLENAGTNKPLGDYVGFMMGSWDRVSWTCSGVFVAENLFLTNWHCGAPREFEQDGRTIVFGEEGYWNSQIVKDTIVDVSFDDDALSLEYIGNKLIAMDQELDFALIEMVPLDASKRMLPLPINLGPLTNNQGIKIVHHPEALPKRITIGCRVESSSYPSWEKSIAGVDFSHNCDTEGGSSGGPVFNSNNELIGLHHRGFKVNLTSCQEEDRVNKAVHINKIVEYLQACYPEVIPRLLLTTPLGPAPAITCPTPRPTPTPTPTPTATPTPAPTPTATPTSRPTATPTPML